MKLVAKPPILGRKKYSELIFLLNNSATSRTWYSIWWVWILILIGFIITIGFIPLIINYLFKITFSSILFQAEWTAGDALEFYGTVLGSVATIGAVVATIIFTSKQNRRAELFQQNMLIADSKKIFVNEKYESLFRKLTNIKDVILQNSPHDDNLLEMLMSISLMPYLTRLIDCNRDIDYVESLQPQVSKIGLEFIKRSRMIIESILFEFYKLAQEVEKVKAELNLYENRQSQDRIEKVIESITNKYKLVEADEDKSKSINDIYSEFKDTLNDLMENYKTEYLELFNQYYNHLKQEQQKTINDLYKFDYNNL